MPKRPTNSGVTPSLLLELLRINDRPIFPKEQQIQLNSLDELIAFVSKKPDQKLDPKKSVVVINFLLPGMKINCDEEGHYSAEIGSKTYLFPTHVHSVFVAKA